MRLNFYPDNKVLECVIGENNIRDIPADCDVRNEVNGRRRLHDPKQVRYAMTHDSKNTYPVMPRVMPSGEWKVSYPRERPDNKYLAPYYIPTDAEQYLEIWELDQDGGYAKATGKKVLDIGYGLHFSTSKTTVGCIRIFSKSDLLWLVHQVNERLVTGNEVTLSV